MSYSSTNSSYQALQFFAHTFSGELYLIDHIWASFCNLMRESNEVAYFREDSWEQDWLLAKYAARFPGFGIKSHYDPPDDFTTFPSFDTGTRVASLSTGSDVHIQHTHRGIQRAALFGSESTPPSSLSAPYTLDAFYDLRSHIERHGDVPMTQVNQVLAWVKMVLGELFTGIVLTPIETSPQDLFLAMQQRMDHVWAEKDVYEDTMSFPELIQWKLDVFYNADITATDFIVPPCRQGQSEKWLAFWSWMSADITREQALTSVQVAAGLFNHPVLSIYLQEVLRSANESVRTHHLLIAAVMRRWALTLQVLAWLEEALQQSWTHIRPPDLMCFAFSALRPHWPRRVLAISHRSRDAKPWLREMKIWQHFSHSIDATFIPQWETNTAMVWGLFSTVPGLIRIRSDHYDQSVWCLREKELIAYLAGHSDFLQERYLIEVDVDRVHTLDRSVSEVETSNQSLNPEGRFPRLTTVFKIIPFEPWENRLLAGIGAFRLIYLMTHDPELTAELCLNLARGWQPPDDFPLLTNHPEGWLPFTRLLQAFHNQWADDNDTFPLAFPPDDTGDSVIDPSNTMALERIMDLSDGTHQLEDVLAAFEWHYSLLPSLIGNKKYGDFFAIDLRGVQYEAFLVDDPFMVIRGLNRIRVSTPVWVLQTHEQNVESWFQLGAKPIFTQHVREQWDWMLELLIEPQWPARLDTDSGIRFSKKLSERCARTRERDAAYYS